MFPERETEIEPFVRPLAGPFPNLRVRELVKTIVTDIIETCDHCRMSAPEQSSLALGIVRGARLTAENLGDDVSAPFLADLLDTLNRTGIEGIRRLVEVVTGHDLLADDADTDHEQTAQPLAA